MKEVKYKIRLAITSDIERLTNLHCKSFKTVEHLPVFLGYNYVKAYYRWQVISNDVYVLVAEIEDEIIGLVAVCDGSFTKAMFIACLPEFIISILSNPKKLFSKMLRERLFRQPEIAKGTKKIVNDSGFAQMIIGVVEKNYRGTGVFGDLIEATIEFSKGRGSKAIRAGVYKINKSCRKTFIKSGWTEIHQLESKETIFFGVFFDETIATGLGVDSGEVCNN